MGSQFKALTGVICASAIALMGLCIPSAFATEGENVTPENVTITITDVEPTDVYEAYRLLDVETTVVSDATVDEDGEVTTPATYKYEYSTLTDSNHLGTWKALYEAITGKSSASVIEMNAIDDIYAYFAFADKNADEDFYETLLSKLESFGLTADVTDVHAQSADELGVDSKTGYALRLDVGTAGYYLVHQTNDVPNPQTFLVDMSNPDELTDNSLITAPKNKDVTFKLQIKDYATSTGTESDWQDSGDYSKVNYATSTTNATEFQLKETATLKTNIPTTDTDSAYPLAFHTQVSDGLTANTNADAIHVYVGDPEDGGVEIDPASYTISTTGSALDDGDTFVITFNDNNLLTATVNDGEKTVGELLRSYTTEYPTITVLFNASLNDAAVPGEVGNDVTAYVTYKNEDGETTSTESDLVRVFTYQLEVSKVDSHDQPLEGATFTLCQLVDTNAAHTNGLEADGSDAECAADDVDGVWKLVSTEEASERVVASDAADEEPGAGEDEDADATENPDPSETPDVDDENDDENADETGGEGDEEVDEAEPAVEYVAVFRTIGDGTYRLVESEVPTDYIAMTPQTFTVSARHDADDEDPQLTELDESGLGATVIRADGLIAATVINKSENEQLPSTGGMGTRLLYIAGGVAILIGLLGLAYALKKNAEHATK